MSKLTKQICIEEHASNILDLFGGELPDLAVDVIEGAKSYWAKHPELTEDDKAEIVVTAIMFNGFP